MYSIQLRIAINSLYLPGVALLVLVVLGAVVVPELGAAGLPGLVCVGAALVVLGAVVAPGIGTAEVPGLVPGCPGNGCRLLGLVPGNPGSGCPGLVPGNPGSGCPGLVPGNPGSGCPGFGGTCG